MKPKNLRIAEKKAYIEVEKKIKNKKYYCLFKDCNEIAVNSHSQQKNGPLKTIAEGGKFFRLDDNLQKNLDVKTNKLNFSFSLKGVKESTTFPGFCRAHENIFSVFEDKELSVGDGKQACLLFYRTISYEKSRKRREVFRWEELQTKLAGVYSINKLFGLNPFIDMMKRHISVTCKHHITIAEDMIRSENYEKISTKWVRIPKNVNVSCSSVINLHLDDYSQFTMKNRGKPIPSFTFNLIPCSGSTHIIISWLSEFDQYADWLVNIFDDLKLLESFINRFAFCDSEDTCINPTLWRQVENPELIVKNMKHVAERGRLDSENVPKLISFTN